MRYEDNSYRAICLRVIDGDTVHLEVDLGLRVKRVLDVRLVGIDAPECRGATFEKGVAAKEALEALLFDVFNSRSPDAKPHPLIVRFSKGKSFDRWLGRIFLVSIEKDGTTQVLYDVQAAMVESGHAVEALK